MYTPTDLEATEFNATDRPYGGWSYLGGVFQAIHHERKWMLALGLEAGVTGKWSGAAATQTVVHSLVDATTPLGWGHQIDENYGIVVRPQAMYRVGDPTQDRLGRFDAQLDIYGGAAIGNIYSNLNLGTEVRVGFNLPNEFLDRTPSKQCADEGSRKLPLIKAYVFLGAEGRLVGHNVFIDGNTIRIAGERSLIYTKFAVRDIRIGGAVSYKRLTYAYRAVDRSSEFGVHDPGAHHDRKPPWFGAHTVMWSF